MKGFKRDVILLGLIGGITACQPDPVPPLSPVQSMSVLTPFPTPMPMPLPTVIPTPIPLSFPLPPGAFPLPPFPRSTPTPLPTPWPSVPVGSTPVPERSGLLEDEPDEDFYGELFDYEAAEGYVYDDKQRPLEGVKIQVTINYPHFAFYAETLTRADGHYAFNGLPSGLIADVVASREGYIPRIRREVFKMNKSGWIDNRYDFGTSGSPLYSQFGIDWMGLTQLPEVSVVVPEHGDINVSPTAGFELHFPKPVQPRSVEENFEVTSLPRLPSGERQDSIRFNHDAFDTVWNAAHTHVRFVFKPSYQLPVSRDFNRTPSYRLTLRHQDGLLRASDGHIRAQQHFKLGDGNFQDEVVFVPQADTAAPRLEALKWNAQQQALSLMFSEPLHIRDLTREWGGGTASARHAPAAFAAYDVSAETAAQNYRLHVRQPGLPEQTFNWADLQGTAQLDPAVPTNTVVLLKSKRFAQWAHLFAAGNTLEIEVAETVQDPAGNSVDPAHRHLTQTLE
ncbi:MAG: carboxypeptidase-like regulatory domain-containing protein [Candidatus Sericytochromatia bacterium]